jgi:hypothetical protein
MKLIFCPNCSDVVRLMDYFRECECKESFGFYEADGLNATIGGKAIPIGFSNPTFKYALEHQPKDGAGFVFDAFVIPQECSTIKYRNKQEE